MAAGKPTTLIAVFRFVMATLFRPVPVPFWCVLLVPILIAAGVQVGIAIEHRERTTEIQEQWERISRNLEQALKEVRKPWHPQKTLP